MAAGMTSVAIDTMMMATENGFMSRATGLLCTTSGTGHQNLFSIRLYPLTGSGSRFESHRPCRWLHSINQCVRSIENSEPENKRDIGKTLSYEI
jgi:hypothetical protein